MTRRMLSAAEGRGDKGNSVVSKQIKKMKSNGTQNQSVSKGWSAYLEKIQILKEEAISLTFDPIRCSWWPIPILLLLAEFFINVLVIQHVKYTEIDWNAYMQACIIVIKFGDPVLAPHSNLNYFRFKRPGIA